MYASYKAQEDCIDEPPPHGRWPGIVLRYQWPPNFTPPLPGYLYIHQQVWPSAPNKHTQAAFRPLAHLITCLVRASRGHIMASHLWGTAHCVLQGVALRRHSQHMRGFLGAQAFEFDGVPEAWIEPLNSVADEVSTMQTYSVMTVSATPRFR